MSAAVAGERVYYFDRENGAPLTKVRIEGIFEAHEWPDVIAEGRFLGRHYPQLRTGLGADSLRRGDRGRGRDARDLRLAARGDLPARRRPE